MASLLNAIPASFLTQPARIYHLVQPYFFAHHHFHRRKVQCLRDAGFDAWILACVPEALYREHEDRYRAIMATGMVKLLRVRDVTRTNRVVGLFFVLEALVRSCVVVHALRCDPAPLIKLRRLPVIGSRIRYVLEYEGDMPSELVYQEAYQEYPRPPELPPTTIRQAHEALLESQMQHVEQADGVVLMSQEHVALWESRLGRSISACVLPTLADPKRIRFDQGDRVRTRNELGVSDRMVLIYVGNAICKWQRFDAMAAFVAALSKRIPRVWFLALVRVDDLDLARQAVAFHGLSERATVLHAASNDVSRYLSAADLALFLRHRHTMNQVVTSGKLGEYLSAGLPLVTTGANAEVLNQLIRELDAGAFVPDTLEVNDELISRMKSLEARSGDSGERARISTAMIQRFSGAEDSFDSYTRFVRRIMLADRVTQ